MIVKTLSGMQILLLSPAVFPWIFVNLYKKYISLKLRKLEKSPRFEVMSWQPF